MTTIRLQVTELLFDIRNKSYEECQSITDIDARYRTEAGTEKTDEIRRCLTEAVSRLHRIAYRWTAKFYKDEPTWDDADIPSEDYHQDYVFELDFTQREAEGKDKILADLFHEYVVEATLAKFYSSVNAGDLSNKHSLLAIEADRAITDILPRKSVPRSRYDTSKL